MNVETPRLPGAFLFRARAGFATAQAKKPKVFEVSGSAARTCSENAR